MGISNIEIGACLKFFNQSGYVLDFSTADFDAFTMDVVGVPLCATYKMSKGRSLEAYVQSAGKDNVVKLFAALLQYYELSAMLESDEHYNPAHFNQYKKCKVIIERVKATAIANVTIDRIKEEFNSDFINAQIDLMLRMQGENPTEAIGKSKELVESCCKTILEKENIPLGKDWDVPRLVDETMKHFKIMPRNIPDNVKGAESIRKVLGNLKGIVQGMAEIRNIYGSGHGKSGTYTGLETRHASLAVGCSTTLVRFLWDSYEHYNLAKGK